jgi:hypothetical protein
MRHDLTITQDAERGVKRTCSPESRWMRQKRNGNPNVRRNQRLLKYVCAYEIVHLYLDVRFSFAKCGHFPVGCCGFCLAARLLLVAIS